MITLEKLVEAEPDLATTLKKRDRIANTVCAILEKGKASHRAGRPLAQRADEDRSAGGVRLRQVGVQLMDPTKDGKEHNYECFYRGGRCSVQEPTTYDAQKKAAEYFKARKSWDVVVVLADVPVAAAGLP